MAAAFIAVATAPFAVAAAHAASAPARLVPPQATARLALQNNTPVPARSTPVPLQADVAQDKVQDTASNKAEGKTPAPVQDAAAPKPEAGKQDAAAAAPDGKQDAAASNCPGNPNALGTSRVLAIDPADFKRIGHMQYPDSLPLQDKEVVITFDDGPIPPYSNQILDILASQCVKVTYFLVGEMARAYPAIVRHEYEAGHTIGTHSEHHPLHFGELSPDRMRSEIDVGISDVAAALGDTKYLAPFFRLPGLDRSNRVEDELGARHLIVFSSDTLADDWRHIGPEQIRSLALKRLQALGKGILLLHDIHAKTVAALPGILKDLKDNGFRIVQVVPSASYMIAMANKPKARMIASAVPEELKIGGSIDNPRTPTWPQPAALSGENLKPDVIALPAPDASAFAPDSGVDDSANVQWPEQPMTKAASAASSEDDSAEKASGHARHRKHDADSDEHDRHHRRHERARNGRDGHRADLATKIKSVAALFTPTPAH